MKRAWILLCLLLIGCQRPLPTTQAIPINSTPQQAILDSQQTTVDTQQENTITPPPHHPATPSPTLPIPPSPTPYFTGTASPVCGQLLPIVTDEVAAIDTLVVDETAVATLRALVPDNAWTAVQQMLDHPETVGLALFQMGDEANGIYLNAERPMPVASIAKVITLAAYAEAVDQGELNPETRVPLETLEKYYLPNFDLGAHPRAVRELRESGRLLADETAVTLNDIAWMMMRHSSNAAADYLHRLLGQRRIEETAVALGVTEHTAPCTFLGQFLAMGNHTQAGLSERTAVVNFIDTPTLYQQEVERLADAYITQQRFREMEQAWRSRNWGPSFETQRLFSNSLAPKASPLAYATMMARLAQNGLATPESSFVARRIIEWPMVFEVNQEQFTNLGYKNGALPGILTTIYYAYRPGEPAPIVIALFYQDLPNQTYRQWRRTIPDDEFARWALANPEAIPALRAVFGGVER